MVGQRFPNFIDPILFYPSHLLIHGVWVLDIELNTFNSWSPLCSFSSDIFIELHLKTVYEEPTGIESSVPQLHFPVAKIPGFW